MPNKADMMTGPSAARRYPLPVNEIWPLSGEEGSTSGEELWEKRILDVTRETKRYRPLRGIGRQQSSVGELL